MQQSVSICRNLYPIHGTTNLQHCKSSLCIYSRVLCFSGRKRRWARIKVCLYMLTSQNFRFIRHRSALTHLILQLRKSTPREAVCCVFHLTYHRGKTRSQVSWHVDSSRESCGNPELWTWMSFLKKLYFCYYGNKIAHSKFFFTSVPPTWASREKSHWADLYGTLRHFR